jgi:hypothetical protein
MLNLKRNVIAAIAVISLSLPLVSMAQSVQSGKETRSARVPVKRSPASYKDIYNTTQTPFKMTRRVDDSAYRGSFTLPEFGPDYHGSNGG